jgi:hypothetical protein
MGRWVGGMNGLGLLCLLCVGPARAASFDLDNEALKAAGLDPHAVESELGAKIDGKVLPGEQPTLLSGMANATAISARGMGVDYGLDVKRFVAGVGVGSGIAYEGSLLGRDDDEVVPSGGFSAQLSVMAGICPGGFVPGDNFLDRVRVFVHWMSFDMPSQHILAGSLQNFGGSLQLQLLDGANFKVGAWNGLALTGGYDATLFRLRLESDLPIDTTVDGTKIGWDATGSYEIDATTSGIPLEVSTALRVLVITVFAGAGYDFVTATAERTAALEGPVEAKRSGEDASLGTATVSLEGDADGDRQLFRGFGGAEVRIYVIKLYGQLNVANNDTVGGHVGVRLAW